MNYTSPAAITRVASFAALLVAFVATCGVPWVVVADEPNFESAKNWFPPLRNVWTPVGVKNHPFRFTLLYNGTIVADTHPLRSMPALLLLGSLRRGKFPLPHAPHVL